MIGKFVRGYVEGIGSKTLAFILAGIGAALLAPVLFSKFGISPELTFEILVGLATVIVLGVFKQWHIDAKTGGATTTQYLMTQKALAGIAAVAPDHTIVDRVAKQILEAMTKAAAGEPPGTTAGSSALAAAPLPPAAVVPPVPPSS